MSVVRTSLPDQVFRLLVEGVLSGRYAPGERLPPQRTLAAELGVNMASLREGIKRLEQLRLVEVRHGDAMRVTDWRTHGGLDVLAYAAQQFTGPLFEARRLLLTQAAALAAQRRTEDQAATLADLAAQDLTQWTDLAFMAAVIQAADNLVFTLILNQVRDLYLKDLVRYAPLADARFHPLYRAVSTAVTARDSAGAERAMHELASRQEEAMRDPG